MRKFLITSAIVAAFSGPAFGQVELAELTVGGEVRLSTSYGWEHRADVWRLNADGTLSGVYETSREASPRGSFYRHSGAVSGRWRLEGSRLCVEGTGFERPGRNCYSMSKGSHSEREFAGAHEQTGQIWHMFIYPRAR